jgi:hypothetical protein
MSTTCDFDVAVRIIAADGTTVLANLNDPPNGLSVITVQEPEETVRAIRTTAPRVDGSYRAAEAEDDGFLVVVVEVDGTSWSQTETRWQAVRTAYRTEWDFYIETEIEGVTKLWRTERPDVAPAGLESASLVLKMQTYSLRFRVQPNPTVTG